MIWSGINSLISSISKNKISNFTLDVDCNLTSDKKLIAESFNKYFTQIAEKTKEKLPRTKNSFRDFLDKPCGNSFIPIFPTTPEEVKNNHNLPFYKQQSFGMLHFYEKITTILQGYVV